jgi:hypothetical protein
VLLTALGIGGRPLSELLPDSPPICSTPVPEALRSWRRRWAAAPFSAGSGSPSARSSGLTQVAVTSSMVGALATAMAIATDKCGSGADGGGVGFAMSTAGIAIQTSIQVATDRAMRDA